MSYLYKLSSNNNASNINNVSPDSFFEKDIENIVELNPHLIFCENLLLIGRQVKTDTGKIIDLLGIDSNGRIVVIELKRHNAPRDVIGQVIDYASWLDEIPERELETIAKKYFDSTQKSYKSLFEACKLFYNTSDIIINRDEVVIIILAHDFPNELSRNANFLSERGILLFCISFKLFISDDEKYILIQERSSPLDITKERLPKKKIQELSTKQYDRSIFNNLKEKLDIIYENLFFNSLYTIAEKLTIYQPIDGHRIVNKISWQYGTGKLELRIDYFREDNELSISILTKRKSDLFIEKFNDPTFKKIINSQLIIEEYRNNPCITFYFPKTIELNQNIVKDILKIHEEMFKPLLEKLLT